MVLYYEIWSNRNDEMFNGEVREPLTIVSFALQHQAAFKEANDCSLLALSQRSSHPWSMPPAPHYKVNFDTSISTIKQVFSIGVVIRSYDGQFIVGLLKRRANRVIYHQTIHLYVFKSLI